MTAEIAIINRSAIALATDSAVTLRVRGKEKIYNSADKLFELSTKDPIGIMIYNNLEFMGISLEVAIKQFRDHDGAKHYTSVVEASEAFFKYITDDCANDYTLLKNRAYEILSPEMKSLYEEWFSAVGKEYHEKQQETDFPGILDNAIRHRISLFENASVTSGFESITQDVVISLYRDLIDEVRDRYFEEWPLSDTHKEEIERLCYFTLTREIFSETLTGIVFAGFGEHEQFPSLLAYEVDGIIAGALKKREINKVTTSRTEITGEILPFAQREMVDRFLYGIDPEFEEGIEEFLEIIIKSSGEAIKQSLPRASKATKEKIDRGVDMAAEVGKVNWRDKMVPRVKNKFMQEVRDMVFMMPKQELAVLAQELINITSVKRKFSSGRESVGGPVDVAIISRIDGFVWVERKHYFMPELNPRYFVRKFGAARLGE